MAAQQATLTEEEYARYAAQLESIQKVCKQYEDEPGDFGKLVDLIQEVGQHVPPVYVCTPTCLTMMLTCAPSGTTGSQASRSRD